MKRLELRSVSVKSRRALDCYIAAEGWVTLLGRGIYWKWTPVALGVLLCRLGRHSWGLWVIRPTPYDVAGRPSLGIPPFQVRRLHPWRDCGRCGRREPKSRVQVRP